MGEDPRGDFVEQNLIGEPQSLYAAGWSPIIWCVLSYLVGGACALWGWENLGRVIYFTELRP